MPGRGFLKKRDVVDSGFQEYGEIVDMSRSGGTFGKKGSYKNMYTDLEMNLFIGEYLAE
ncbi:hypothetical protein X474_26510 [Dethiosulfatarculus sandiegensis]|uniref:Uncharacterized protein n=1 Tax=Dethiosulfatarculus sandiegensis TaxID=1429043 RepID=A0A0D2JN93_9BACT|nr:hypothetical protein X474_26510 [Dethiosulfatarculus sandiegensis]